ncbi:MAG: hypothetical protein HXX16_08960 [Bacteroidales bacterium]|nr:hypothetical protein [Bacteroidales bacterium]
MIRKRFSLYLILISILFITKSNAIGQCSFIQADKFDNVWVVNNHEVICFDKQFKKIGSYSNILLGNPTYIDALDPFRVVVFYQGSQSVVILNNSVAQISEPIKLQDKGISDANLVCRSNKGGFWIFNRNRWEILYFDSGFNPTGEKIIPDITFSDTRPTFIQENEGILYLAFQNKGICRFDSFGARMGDIPIKIDSYFTFIDGSIVYSSNGKLFQYILESNQSKGFETPCKCIPIKVRSKFLFFDGGELVVS